MSVLSAYLKAGRFTRDFNLLQIIGNALSNRIGIQMFDFLPMFNQLEMKNKIIK